MKKLAYSVIGIGGILTILILAQNIFIPFVYGIILWFLGRFFKNLLHKVPFLKKRIPNWLINTFIFVVIVLGISAI
ncbi:MAG: hypothetical protein AAF717_21750, partial [Bacteroidota bacterium]